MFHVFKREREPDMWYVGRGVPRGLAIIGHLTAAREVDTKVDRSPTSAPTFRYTYEERVRPLQKRRHLSRQLNGYRLMA